MAEIIAYVGIIVTILGSALALYRELQKSMRQYAEGYEDYLKVKLDVVQKQLESLREDDIHNRKELLSRIAVVESGLGDIEKFLSLSPFTRMRKYKSLRSKYKKHLM